MVGYLILGAGKFGRLALMRLSQQDEAANFWVVDRAPQALAGAQGLTAAPVHWVEAEAIAFLAAHLGEDGPWDWLIPGVPVHVAFAWLWQGPLAGAGWQTLAVPEAVGHLVSLAQRGPEGELYLSRATHLCPDDCGEPDTVCPVSGESRETPLYQELAALKLPGFKVRVIPSLQLAPGVGGYSPRQLPALALEVAALKGKFLIATACRCHGVVHALKGRQGRRV